MSGRQACLDLCYALYLAPPILGDLPKLAKLLVHSTLHTLTHMHSHPSPHSNISVMNSFM